MRRNRDPAEEAITVATIAVLTVIAAILTFVLTKAFECHARHSSNLGLFVALDAIWSVVLLVALAAEAVGLAVVATVAWFVGTLLLDAHLTDMERRDPPEATLDDQVGRWW